MKFFYLFILCAIFSSNLWAATGTGHAQAELTNPLTVTNTGNVNFGTVAIDPAAGAQIVSMDLNSTVTCPATYVCSGTPRVGRLSMTGAPDVLISLSLEGSVAVLSNGVGQTLSFDPEFWNETDAITLAMSSVGTRLANIQGSLFFSGNEPAGTYNTTNSGGSGYVVTVSY